MENKRLTTKCDGNEYIVGVTTNGGYDEDAVLEKQYEANQKLGKLEDLFDSYGIETLEDLNVILAEYFCEIKDHTFKAKG